MGDWHDPHLSRRHRSPDIRLLAISSPHGLAVVLLPEVLEAPHIASAFDYLLRIAVADLASYESFHADRLTALPRLANITSYIVMSRLK
jgi:DNA-binding Lrp family transcriptional regulator